ncbi:hypothetical protein D3C72_1078200 [compost metagenome]
MPGHRGARQGGIDAAGIAQRIFVVEAAVQVEVQGEVAGRLRQLHQQPVLHGCIALGQGMGLLCEHRQMCSQGAGADAGAHAQQHDQPRLVRLLCACGGPR